MNLQSAVFVIVCVVVIGCDAAPSWYTDDADLAMVLSKANLLLDRLLARTADTAQEKEVKREDEGPEPEVFEAKRQMSNTPTNVDDPDEDASNKDKKVWYWVPHRNTYIWLNSAVTRAPLSRPERDPEQDDIENGDVPFASKTNNDADKTDEDEVSLKEAIHWLQELREERNHKVARERD